MEGPSVCPHSTDEISWVVNEIWWVEALLDLQVRPQGPQRTSKGPPEVLKGCQRTPRHLPRQPPELPKRPKELPRTPKGSPRTSLETPKGALRTPKSSKDLQGASKGPPRNPTHRCGGEGGGGGGRGKGRDGGGAAGPGRPASPAGPGRAGQAGRPGRAGVCPKACPKDISLCIYLYKYINLYTYICIQIYIETGLADQSGSRITKRYKYTGLSVLDPCLFLKTGLPRPFLKRRREKAWLKIHQTL